MEIRLTDSISFLDIGKRGVPSGAILFAKRGVPSGAILFADMILNEIKIKIYPNIPKTENGLIQMIRIGKFIRQKWVDKSLTICTELST